MVKLLKILGRTVGIILEWLLVFLIAFAFLIRTSPVQTFLAQKATNYLSKELNTKVKIDKVDIVFFDQVALDGFLILDQEKDTLLATKTIFVTLDDYDFTNLKFTVGEIRLVDAFGQLKKDKEGVSSLQFLLDYFKSDESSSDKSIELAIHTIELDNTRFKYDDNQKDPNDFGIDFAHLDVSNVNGSFEDISIIGSDVKAKITNFSAYEKSGLILKNITTEANFGSNGMYLSNATVDINDSKINAPKFNLIYSGFDDFSHFVDSVKFDGQLDESTVSLKDVSLFASALEGMEEIVQIKGKVSDVINNLSITDLDVRVKEKTRLRGSIHLPNFADLDQSSFTESLDYAYVDLKEIQQIKLPKSSSTTYLKLDEYTNRLGYFEVKDVKFDMDGKKFNIASDIISTQLGSVRLDNGVNFEQKDNSLAFSLSNRGEYDLKVEEFDLGAFLQNKDLGIVNGAFSIQGEAFSASDIRFNSIEGKVTRFDFMEYAYSGINIRNGQFKNNRFSGKVDIDDENLSLTYDGYIDLNGAKEYNFTTNVGQAWLNKLNFTSSESELMSTFHVEMVGSDLENLEGKITAEGFHYCEGERDLHVPELTFDIFRGDIANGELDKFTLTSNVVNASIEGKVNFNHLIGNLDYQLSRILPALFKRDVLKDRTHTEDHFEFNLEAQDPDDFLAIFFPELKVSSNTSMRGHYYGESANFVMKLKSNAVKYDNLKFNNIVVDQLLDSNSVIMTSEIEKITYNDTISFNDVFFRTSGGNDQLVSDLTWDDGTPYASHIKWETAVRDKDHFNFVLEPSYFSLNDHRWEIAKESTIQINKDTVSVTELKIEQGNQFISFDGKISNQDKHQLDFDMTNIDLSELNAFLGDDVRLTGQLNSWGHISNPVNNFTFAGDAHIMGFSVNENEIGDIYAHSEWDEPTKSIQLDGDLMYKTFRTFDFEGSYFTEGKKNAKGELNYLAFDLVFENTDISFTNSFLDPDVVDDIEGTLNGKLAITGSPDSPELNGSVRLDNAKANVKLLGAKFGVEGPISVDKDGFYIDAIPIFDEEGNAGSLIGAVYHEGFENFNFDLLVDMEQEGIARDPKRPWYREPLDRFLVMNSEYTTEAIYYGKAYATGLANIYGYADNLTVTVDVKTEKGTDIKFPMYGAGEIDEEYDFITFTQDSNLISGAQERKIDFTGVDLDLHFDVTDDAQLQIIFNEELGDIITAKGNGEMAINLDNLGDIRMDGTYTISQGVYDFTMGVVKQPFVIEKGGNIAWTGSPYNAQLNLKTYKTVSANIAALSADQFSGGTNAHEDIRCYLILTETLLKPAISFDILAPNANDAGKSLIERVRKDNDELNRQFFSLMIANTFQPLSGGAGNGSGGAAVDLLENQINGLLAKVSTDYKLNLNVDSDELTQDNTFEVGLKKGFLDDKLIISGSIGVENEAAEKHNSIIGDVNLEYLLNESGTFRVNIFNESNDKTIIQDQQKGHFTQGIGLNYQEDFNGPKDFKALQAFLDIFRKKEKKEDKDKRKKRQVPVPPKEGEIVPTEDN